MAGAEIQFEFVTVGADRVAAAFRTADTAAEQSAAKQARAAEKAAAATDKAAGKSRDAKGRFLKSGTEATERAAKAEVRATEKSEEAKTRALEKGAAARSRAAEREAKRTADAYRKAAGFGGKGPFGASVISGVRGAATTAVGLGLATVGVAAREEFALRGHANRISVMGHKAGDAFVDPGQIAAQLHATAMGNAGVKSDDLAVGMQKFVELTHDLPGASKHLGTLATAMQSMGTDAEGTAKIMVALQQSFGIKGTQEMRDGMAALEAQAKAAGMPMDSLEGHIMNLAAAGKRFGMTGANGVQQIGGLMAMARQGIGDPEKAEKGAGHFMDKLVEEAPKLAAMGVKVFDKTGKVNDINDVVKNLITKIGGSNMALKQVELGKLLGVGERGGLGVIGAPLDVYRKTFQDTKGTTAEKTKAATEAMSTEIEKLTATTATWDDTVANAAQIQQGSSAQLEAAWEAIRAKVGSDLVPALAGLVPMVTGTTNALDPLVDALTFIAGVIKETFNALVAAGILDAKKEDPMKKYSNAQKALKEFEEGGENKQMTTAQLLKWQEKRAELEGNVTEAEKGARSANLPGRGMSDETYEATYAAMREKRKLDLTRSGSHGNVVAMQRVMYGVIGESDEMKALRDGHEEEKIMGRGRADYAAQNDDTEGVSKEALIAAHERARKAADDNAEAVQEAAKAANEMAAAMSKVTDAANRTTPISDQK